MTRPLFFVLWLLLGGASLLPAAGREGIARQIERAVRGTRASVGVAVLYGDRTITVGNGRRYPLMSLFKLPVAVTALAKMEQEGIAPDSTVRIEPQELLPDTYSPLRDRYPRCTPISGTVTATGVRR